MSHVHFPRWGLTAFALAFVLTYAPLLHAATGDEVEPTNAAEVKVAGVGLVPLTAPPQAQQSGSETLTLPYAEAGLDQREAATVLLNRFTFGARPGDIDRVVAMGLGRWFEQQLAHAAEENALDIKLAAFPALSMTHQQLFSKFPSFSQSTAHARRFYDLVPPADAMVDGEWANRKLVRFRQSQGYLNQEKELYQELAGQKIIRATFSENQLQEVLTDFWQNHFYTSSSNFRSRPWVLFYETEAIRPNALGTFRALLGAAAKHPAMIDAFRGDAQKQTVPEADTAMGRALTKLQANGDIKRIAAIRQELQDIANEEDLILPRRFWPESGPNLEFSRIIMQQTLGSDRAYTPNDLQDTARVLTGWSSLPYGASDDWFKSGFAEAAAGGFVRQGSFLFRADHHDATSKRVLGRVFPAGGGLEEGEKLLDLLAANPATARHIAQKLAEHFVGDQPSEALTATLAQRFERSQGDLRAVLRTLVQSPEFWKQAATRPKIKTPLQYVVSALRATQADVRATDTLVKSIGDMGQPLYAYLDSHGLPETHQWINPATLSARIRFAKDLSGGQLDGVIITPSAEVSLASLTTELRHHQDAHRAVDMLEREGTASPTHILATLLASPQFQLR